MRNRDPVKNRAHQRAWRQRHKAYVLELKTKNKKLKRKVRKLQKRLKLHNQGSEIPIV